MTVALVRWPVPIGGATMRDLTFLLHFLRQGKKWKRIAAIVKIFIPIFWEPRFSGRHNTG